MSPDLSVYLVTEPVDELEHVVAEAVAGGVTLVQLRDKALSSEALGDVAERLAHAGVPVLVNDDLAAAARVDGVHVGRSDASPLQARAALGPEAIVGWSINDPAQLDQTEQLAACSYVAVSPVFATSTKPDHEPPLGLDGVRNVAAGTDLPVVGIGGIDVANAADVVAAGAHGVAVVTAITRADDPRTAAAALVDAVRSAR